MPTLYTLLRALHRHKLVPPEPPPPKSEVFAAPAKLSLLQGARQLTSSKNTKETEASAVSKPTRRVIVIGAGKIRQFWHQQTHDPSSGCQCFVATNGGRCDMDHSNGRWLLLFTFNQCIA